MKSSSLLIRVSLVVLIAVAFLLSQAGDVQATPILLGTASGGLGIYYNNIDVSGAGGVPDGIISGYDENPFNQAYIRMQVGYAFNPDGSPNTSNRNGAAFQFDDTDYTTPYGTASWNDIFSGQPVGSSQFGFDLQATMPTYDSSGGVVPPTVYFADNVNNTVAGATLTPAGPVSWAINDYKEPSGPAAGGSIINSLFRGTNFDLNVVGFSNDLATNGTYTIQIAGKLYTDGLIHWYNPLIPGTNGDNTSNLSDWMLRDYFLFEGTLVYDMMYNRAGWDYGWNTYSSGMENGADQFDFYQGDLKIYAVVVPEPISLAMAGAGIAGVLIGRRKLRKRS